MLYATILNDGNLQAYGCNLDTIMQSPKSHSFANHTLSQYMFMQGVVAMYLLQDMKTSMDIVNPAPG
jgi:hypothetical protein